MAVLHRFNLLYFWVYNRSADILEANSNLKTVTAYSYNFLTYDKFKLGVDLMVYLNIFTIIDKKFHFTATI